VGVISNMKSNLLIETLLILFSAVIVLAGCSNTATSQFPNIGILEEEFNKDLVFYENTAKTTYQSNEYISISFLINSKSTIRMKMNYGLRLFYLKNNRWIELTPYKNIPGVFEKDSSSQKTIQPGTYYIDDYRVLKLNDEKYYVIYPNDSMILKQRSILLPPLGNLIGSGDTEIIEFIQAERIDPNTNKITKIGAFIQYKVAK
jgi:hypothetical protein